MSCKKNIFGHSASWVAPENVLAEVTNELTRPFFLKRRKTGNRRRERSRDVIEKCLLRDGEDEQLPRHPALERQGRAVDMV